MCNNVVVHGPIAGQPMIFAHGFGCDQSMWRHVWPAFADDYRIVLFDYVGLGGSDVNAYDPQRYSSLQGYADDVIELARELDLSEAVFVGHSVSSMVGVLDAGRAPELFSHLVLVGPSPRYIDDEGYVGGFSREDIEGLLRSLESNTLGLVKHDGTGDHGQSGAPRAWPGTSQQLLPRRSGDCPTVRSGHLHVRQPGRPAEDQCPHAGSSMLPGRNRSPSGQRVCPGPSPR